MLIEGEIIHYLFETVFEPLISLLIEEHIQIRYNEEYSAVWQALLAGTIWYADGVFHGVFNVAVSRELRSIGAHYNAHRGGFVLEQGEIPIPLRSAISESKIRSDKIHAMVLATIVMMEETIVSAPTGLTFTKSVDKMVADLQKQFVQTVSTVEGLPKPSPVPPGMTETLRQELAAETASSLNSFSSEALVDLRVKIQDNLDTGGRTDRLAKVVSAEYDIAKRRAVVIAGNGTSRLVAKFRQRRYEDLGITEYVWNTSHDEKVRPTHGESNNHRVLDGRRFSFSSPPIVDSATGRRRHPGEDYGPCRCVALPVLNLPTL